MKSLCGARSGTRPLFSPPHPIKSAHFQRFVSSYNFKRGKQGSYGSGKCKCQLDMAKKSLERTKRQTAQYEVALSFAGEDRAYAERLAKILTSQGVSVFYDEFQRSALWGKDLYQYLQDIYSQRARYCVVFVSKNYLKKNWTKHELKQMQARAFESDREYILPVRLDDAVLPGLNKTIGYLDSRRTPLNEIAYLLLEKLNKPTEGLEINWSGNRASWNGELIEYNGMKVASFWPELIERAQHHPKYLVTAPFDRIPHGKEKTWGRTKITNPCHDCGALHGQYHVPGCDMEQCPACGGQSISCGCIHKAATPDDVKAWEEGED